MTAWKDDDLAKIGAAEEVQIAPLGRDGKPGKPVTVWVVRHEDDLYIRSVRGRRGLWFLATQATHEGRIRAGGVQRDVTFVDADHDINDGIDVAYRAKYRRYAGSILNSVLTAGARSTSMKLVPRTARS